jgi:hypothetical protein
MSLQICKLTYNLSELELKDADYRDIAMQALEIGRYILACNIRSS